MQYDAFATVILLGLLVLFVRGPWKDMCTDYARQIIFQHRDAVFDMAVEGRLEFGSSTYRTIRAALERNIRFAHELSIARFVFFAAPLLRDRRRSQLEIAVSSIADEQLRAEVMEHVYRAQRALIIMMVVKSPLLMVVSIVVAIVSSVGKGLVGWRRKTLRSVAQAVQVEAEEKAFEHARYQQAA